MKMTFVTAAALRCGIRNSGFCRRRAQSRAGYRNEEVPIVEVQPTINTMKVVGVVHKTKAEAETALKADKSCVAL